MKFKQFISLLIIGLLFMSFNNPERISGQSPKQKTDCDSIPQLNQQIVDFVTSRIKKKVGKGECWDLAEEALNSVGAKWNGEYVFGKPVRYQTECVYAGDIIQFADVRIQYEVDGKVYIEQMKQHTAVIYEVKARGNYILAHQNTPFSGKKVGLSPIKLKDINKGKFTIYRPEK